MNDSDTALMLVVYRFCASLYLYSRTFEFCLPSNADMTSTIIQALWVNNEDAKGCQWNKNEYAANENEPLVTVFISISSERSKHFVPVNNFSTIPVPVFAKLYFGLIDPLFSSGRALQRDSYVDQCSNLFFFQHYVKINHLAKEQQCIVVMSCRWRPY